MPKPIAGAFGSGMHTHLSLFEGDVNAFHDPGDEYGLSKVAKHFIAGLLVHADEICAITNQWVNSYKRLIPGYEAPVYKCWARNNRSALVRVPLPKRGKNESSRIEFRAPDPACNPYLAFSVMLAAGLEGIEEGYDLPPEATDNIYELTDEERLAEGIGSLPGSLRDALDAMERSELVAEALGEHVFENFLINKRREWADYKAYVTPFEIERSSVRSDGCTGAQRDRHPARLPRSAAAVARADARPRGLPVEGGRRTRRSRCSTNRPTVGAARSSAPTTTPKARSRCAARCARATARCESILLLVTGAQLHELEHREDLFDDFCLAPFHPKELEARVRHLMFRAGRGGEPGARVVRRPRPQLRDVPGRRSTASRSTSRTWSTSCSSSS